jgi:dihydroorotate dehydrogenase (fumarate)
MILNTAYMGLSLKNPFIVGSSPLTCSVKNVALCASAGAGAVVLKSLFEEQIRNETAGLEGDLSGEAAWHSEVFEYMEASIGMRYGTRDYLRIIRECKTSVDIPVIASVNCISDKWWRDFAGEVEAAGADALELNIAIMPDGVSDDSTAIEDRYASIVRQARKTVKIPVAVKIGPFFSCLPQMVRRLGSEGANAIVLFNRFYRPVIDIETLKFTVPDRWSSPGEMSETARWISLLSGNGPVEFSAATGIHSGDDAVRALLAGAQTVQTVTALMKNGLPHLGVMQERLCEWMAARGFSSLDDFRGLMSQKCNPECEFFGRLQYIRGLIGSQ